MNLSLHFLIYTWNNTTSANRCLLSMQEGIDGGGQSGRVFRKLSKQWWWWWQWDLSHRPCCALCSSQTLGFPVLGSTLIACVWVLCSGCSSVYYLSGSYDQDFLVFLTCGRAASYRPDWRILFSYDSVPVAIWLSCCLCSAGYRSHYLEFFFQLTSCRLSLRPRWNVMSVDAFLDFCL